MANLPLLPIFTILLFSLSYCQLNTVSGNQAQYTSLSIQEMIESASSIQEEIYQKALKHFVQSLL